LLDPSSAGQASNKWIEIIQSIVNFTGIHFNLTLILAVFTVSLLSIAFLTYFQSTLQAAYQQEFSYQTRKRLFKKIITSEWSFLNGTSKHNHIQVLTTEIPKMTTYYYYYLSLATKAIFIITHIVLAFFLSASFTCFVVFVGALVFIMMRKNLKQAALLGAGNIQAFRKMLKHIDDFWITVKMAKVHNSEEFYYKKFDETNQMMLEQQYQQLRNRAIPQLLFTLVGIVSLVLIVYVAYGIVKLPLTSLFVLILLFARIFPQFMSLNSDLNLIISNVESVKMVLAMDHEIPEREFEKTKQKESIEFRNDIEIRNLNFSYNPAVKLFSNFSGSIQANKITGIVGQSGCGKTTLIDILAGLQKVSDGAILIDGIPLNAGNLAIWRNSLGYLPQDSFFIDGTIRENLIWDSGNSLTDEKLFELLKQVNADQLVSSQKQGLDTFIANYQYHFSGGERQRLALVRVLIRNPKLLLLDEATSALDPTNESQIMECLLHLKKEVTIVFVTHRQNLRTYFDQIIDLDTLN
jgi:ATP-binding cassette subfamily C protein